MQRDQDGDRPCASRLTAPAAICVLVVGLLGCAGTEPRARPAEPVNATQHPGATASVDPPAAAEESPADENGLDPTEEHLRRAAEDEAARMHVVDEAPTSDGAPAPLYAELFHKGRRLAARRRDHPPGRR